MAPSRFIVRVLRGRASAVALGALFAVAACDVRVDLGRASVDAGAPVVDAGAAQGDGGALVDGGSVDGGPDVTIARFAVEPGVVSQGQRGAQLLLELRNEGTRNALIVNTPPLVDEAAPSTVGFWVTAATDNAPLLPAGARTTLRFTLDASTPLGALPTPGVHRLCVPLALRAADEPAVPLRASDPMPCAALQVQRPAALEIRLKAPPTVFQGETREAVLQLVNTAEAAATDVTVALGAQVDGQPGERATWMELRILTLPASVPGGATLTATLAVSAALDAPPGVVLLGATVSARDANDPSRVIRLESAPERVRVRPVAKVTLDSLAADLANVRPGGGDARLSLRATNTGLGDGLLSDLVLAFTDAAGAVVTDAWTVTSAPALRDDPLAAGASRVLTASVRRNPQATTGAASTSAAWTSERAEELVRARLQVRTAERVDALEPPASTQAPWSFNIMPLMLEEIPPPPGYAAGARFGAALALLNDPEDGASIYVIGAPGLTPSGLLSVWVAPHQLLGTIDAPRGGDFGAAIAAVGHWLPASPANRARNLVVGAPARDDASLIDPVAGVLAPDDVPLATCLGCGLGSVVAGNPRGERDGTAPGQRLLFALAAPDAPGGAGRVDVVWQPRAGEAPSRAIARAVRLGGAAQGGADTAERFGAALAVADIDGDGDPELIVGAPNYRRAGDTAARGRILVLRPPTYTTLAAAPWSRLEGDVGDELGAALANIGDVDGDGRADLAIGAPGRVQNGIQNAGRVYIISGATGAQLATFEGHGFTDAAGLPQGERFGATLARLSTDRASTLVDFNGDGHPDFAVGAPFASPGGRARAGSVYIVGAPPAPGVLGRVHLRLDGVEPGGEYGAALTHLGDNDNDGYQDLLIGAPGAASLGQSLPGGRAELARGRVFAPIEVAPRIEVAVFDDGALGQPPRRNVTRGGPAIPVRLELRNSSDAPLTLISPALRLYREDGSLVGPSEVTLTLDTPPIARLLQEERAEARFTVVVPATLAQGVYRLGAHIETGQGTTELAGSARHLWIVQRPPTLRVLGLRLVRGNIDRQFLSLGRGDHAAFLADVINTGDAPLVGLQGELVLSLDTGGAPVGLRAEVDAVGADRVLGGEVAVVAARLFAEDSVPSGARGSLRLRVQGADENTSLPVQSDVADQAPQPFVTSRATVRVLSLSTAATPVRAGAAFPLQVAASYPYDAAAPPDATLISEALRLEFSRGTGWTVDAPRPLASIPMCAASGACAGTLFGSRVVVPAGLAPGPVEVTPRFGALDTRAHPLGVYVEGGPDAASFPDGHLTLEVIE